MMRYWDGRFFDRFDGFGNLPIHWGVMVFFGLLLLAALVVGVILLARLAGRNHASSGSPAFPRPAPDSARALEILNERLARGEVNEEEYERIKARLKS